VARQFVVVDEGPVALGAHLELAGVELDPVRIAVDRRKRAGLAARLAAQPQRLPHRLGVLELVEDHEVVQLARAHTIEYVERPGSDVLHVGERLPAVQQLYLAARGPRRLERVIGRGQFLVQQRLATQAVHRPQVLVRRDVRQVPHERTHDRIERPVHDVVRQRLDQVERRLSRLPQRARPDECPLIHGAGP
jgi:hypothetical protein